MKFVGLILLIYLIYKLIWFFVSSSSLKKKMKHLGIILSVYISLVLLSFIHGLILKQSCLWDLDDSIEDYKIALGELPPRSESEELKKGTEYILPPKGTSESDDQLRRLFERHLKERIEVRELGLWGGESKYFHTQCHEESYTLSRGIRRNWKFILSPFDITNYSSLYYNSWWSLIPTN